MRDRIVIDSELSEMLQMESDLTLEKAVAMLRHSESVKKQQSVVRGEESSTLASVGKSYSPRGKPHCSRAHRYKSRQAQCGECGKSPPHAKQAFPPEFHKCHMTGHYR